MNFAGIGQKVELIIFLKEVSDPYLFQSLYVDEGTEQIYSLFDLMVEDMSLQEPFPERLEFVGLGRIEAHHLKKAATILKDIVNDVGPLKSNNSYISHHKWLDFIAEATDSLNILIAPK